MKYPSVTDNAYKGAVLHIGDVLYDLQDNGFMVKGVEMFKKNKEDTLIEDQFADIMFEPL